MDLAASVLASIDAEAIARDTLDFVNVASETGAEGAGSSFFSRLLEREGFETILDPIETDRPNVYARWPGASGSHPPLMFNGHIDTIPIGNSDAPRRDGDWIVGRGSEDMKGGLVSLAHAVSALRKAGVRLRGDVWLTAVIGHETPKGRKEGPLRLIELLRAGRMRAGAIVIAEGPCAIWRASLGSAIFRIGISSSRGVVHTIKVPFAENPARWLGRLLEEFAALEGSFASAGAHPLCGRERLNVGMIRAGDYVNRLPTPVEALGTWRWTPGRTEESVRRQLENLCGRLSAESGMSFEFSLEAAREPFETSEGHPVVQALSSAAETVAGAKPEQIGMGLVGDGNLFANLAPVPCVYYGPAHETAHSDHERVSVRQLAHCAKVYALAAMRFSGIAG
jgi:acetylornithine deacetylase/succinyl-diaminopimelate desuccinylase-like protein